MRAALCAARLSSIAACSVFAVRSLAGGAGSDGRNGDEGDGGGGGGEDCCCLEETLTRFGAGAASVFGFLLAFGAFGGGA